MAFITIPPGDVDQGSVVDESLMSGKVKNDLDDLNSRVVALEALSGGGVAASDAADMFADIIAGGETNEAKFWKLRHYPGQSNLDGSTETTLEDFEQKDTRERFVYDPKFTLVNAFSGVDANQYFNKSYIVWQNEQIQFRIKKGENFFCIGSLFGASSASVVRVYVDGVNANTVGLKDEQGNTVSATLNMNNGTTYYGKVFHYYGLDGEEHVITIKNENGSAQGVWINFVDIGFRSVDYAIDHKIKLNAGVAAVGNISAAFDEGEFSFTQPTDGLCNGHTAMLKISESGTVSAVDGLSPAKTQIRPKTTVAFSSAVTTLPVKNVFPFPTSGICLFQMPDGSKWFFSYNGKTDTTPQAHSLDAMVWQRQPNEDFNFGPDKAGATFVANEIRGHGLIEYWAKAPILIDGTNNKIDFEITVNGVTTLHAATVPSGRYSADIVPLSTAIVNAMKTAKPINGEYFAKWNEGSQLWSIGVNDPEVSQLDFEWATGANSSTSLGPTLGFSSDSTGEKTYIAATTKQHKAHRVFVADQQIRSADHPTIKYNWAENATHSDPMADALIEKTPGLSAYRRYTAGGFPLFDIYPDDDCCGITLYFMREDQAMYFTAMIDNMGKISLVQADRPNDTSDPAIGSLVPVFLSFPKGTHKITIYNQTDDWSEIETGTSTPTFFGYRQHYTKPQWESLTLQEKVLKTFEIAPIRLFGTYYGHNAALYTPQPSNDNINSITESGTWANAGGTNINGTHRTSGTLNAYVETEFVLQGDGGGIGLVTYDDTTHGYDMVAFLSTAAIVEATDMVDRFHNFSTGGLHDRMSFFYIGLKAGTYKARFKNQHASTFINSAIVVFDTVPPQQNAPTLTDIANTGQSLAFPLYGRRRSCERYASFKRPSYIGEGTWRRGIVSHFDHALNNLVDFNPTDETNVHIHTTQYWNSLRSIVTAEFMQYTTFCRSMTAIANGGSTYSTVVQPSIDGRNLNTVSFVTDFKGGSSPAIATRNSYPPKVFFDFQYPCTFNASLTYNIADTRGLRTGKAILVDNTGAKEEVFISSFVTDVSFTISKALTVLTPANVVRVLFWGMHNMRLTATNATQWYMNHWFFEPLPIEESILQKRISSVTEQEVVELEQVLAAAGVGNNQNFNWPMHSDGETADPKAVDVMLLKGSLSTVETLRRRMSAFVPDAASNTTAKTVLVRSTKDIVKNFDHKVRG